MRRERANPNVVDRLGALIAWLRGSTAVESAVFDRRPPANAFDLERARAFVDDALLDVYRASDGFRVEVRFVDVGGEGVHRLVLPTLRDNVRGYARRLGYEVSGKERVQVLDLAPLEQQPRRIAITVGTDEVLVFDGYYAKRLLCGVRGFFNAAIRCLFTSGWLNVAVGADDGRVKERINAVRDRLGLPSLPLDAPSKIVHRPGRYDRR